MPPELRGLPVTQALPSMSVVCMRLYWSAIHAISRSPVPMSGAGTFCEGWIRSRLANSYIADPGWHPSRTAGFAGEVARLPRLQLRGLMALPPEAF